MIIPSHPSSLSLCVSPPPTQLYQTMRATLLVSLSPHPFLRSTQTQSLRLSSLRHVPHPHLSVCIQNLFVFVSQANVGLCTSLSFVFFCVVSSRPWFFLNSRVWVSEGSTPPLGSTLEMLFLTSLGVCSLSISLRPYHTSSLFLSLSRLINRRKCVRSQYQLQVVQQPDRHQLLSISSPVRRLGKCSKNPLL